MFFVLGFALCVPTMSYATLDVGDIGLKESGEKIYGSDDANLAEVIGSRIVTPVLGLVGAIFFLMILYSGVLWMTARGVSTQVDKAQEILKNSTFGLVLILLAYSSTYFIVDLLTNTAA